MERKTPPVFYRREGFDSVFKRKGVKKLDALILTHADQDHIGEAGVLIKNHRVKRLIVPVGFVKEPKDQTILNMAKENNIPLPKQSGATPLQPVIFSFRCCLRSRLTEGVK